ncbi:hypothetical protein GCM10020221_07490 [Streptomyces thioluteus]|uniref:Uncharacterized protein n=1 Tax=Streptomyces thioluteus TaxID=66431 RepID=A0ABP6IYN2_STRTU
MFGVVVVLEDQPALGGPAHQFAPPAAAEHHPGRELVGGREEYGPGAGGAQRVDADALGVHRHRGRAEPPVPEVLARAEGSGVLHRDVRDPVAPQHLGDQPHRLGHPGDHDHVVRVRPDPPGARQPVDEGPAQLGLPTRVPVAERRGGEAAEHGALGGQPRRARERGQVRQPG